MLAGGLSVAGIALELGAVVPGYVVLTTLYSRWLSTSRSSTSRRSTGFFLRAVAGGVASDIPISRWFLIVAGGGSLFLVPASATPSSSRRVTGPRGRRAALAEYSSEYLRALLSTTARGTVVAYVLWSFERHGGDQASRWTILSAVPFVLGIMRYGLLVDRATGRSRRRSCSATGCCRGSAPWLRAWRSG